MKLLFLDESGDHSLDHIDRDYPVFVLGGVIVDRAYHRRVVEPRIQAIKRAFFDEPVILHTADIVRGKNGFEALNNTDTRLAFYRELNALMRELQYTVIACAIKKHAFVEQHGHQASDPYTIALDILVEQFTQEIGDHDNGDMIFAERRRPDLDRELEEVWNRLRHDGGASVAGDTIDRCIVDLSLKGKQANLAGLELADLVVSPIGRAVVGKPTAEDWEIIEGKFRRVGGTYADHGLRILPESVR